jgi:hypothetical protein
VGEVKFAGYAAIFDAPDRAGDVMRRGAFGAPRKVPLLWQHRGRPIGSVAVTEDARGLRVSGTIDAPEVARLVASGGLSGLSVGYRVTAQRQGARRELIAVDLREVSLVAQPMQRLARVTDFQRENEHE